MIFEKETEIKLRIINEKDLSEELYDSFIRILSGKKTLRNTVFSSHPARDISTVYFDTKDMDLKKSKMIYRVRKEDSKRVATVKTEIKSEDESSGVLAKRLEQTQVFPEDIPDSSPEVFRGTELYDSIREVTGRKNLYPVFSTEFKRKGYTLERKGRYKIYLCIDSGEIKAGEKSEKIHEIELELTEGKTKDILETAYVISKMIPVSTDNTSKYARGIFLAGKGKDIFYREKYTLPDEDTPLEVSSKKAVAFILREINHLMKISKSHPENPGNIHALRVNTRHLISVLDFANPVIKNKRCKKMKKLAGKILKKTSRLRESDIFYKSLKEYSLSGKYEDEETASRLTGIAGAFRQYERKIFSENPGEKYLSVLTLLCEKWINEEPRHESPSTGKALSSFIRQRDILISSIPAYLKKPDISKLHKIRIAAKEKRYVMKYFSPGRDKSEDIKTIENLKDIQDILGDLNDVKENIKLADEILPAHSETKRYVKWIKRKKKRLVKKLYPDPENDNER